MKNIISSNTNIIKSIMITLTIGIIIVSGASGIVINSEFSPIYVVIVVLASLLLYLMFRKPEWALYTAIFVVFLPDGLITPSLQSLLNRFLTIVAFSSWFFDWVLHRKKLMIIPNLLLMAAFLVWASISLFWVNSLSLGLNEIQVYLLRFLGLLLLLPNVINTRQKFNILMNILASIGWFYIICGLFIFISKGYSPGSRFQIFDMNPNSIGPVLLLTMTGVLWNANKSIKLTVFKKISSYIFIIITLVLILLSGSRGSAISISGTLLIFLVFRNTRSWGMIGVIIVLTGFLLAPNLFMTTINRFTSNDGSTPLGGREVLWEAAWQVIKIHPIRGVGIGNSSYSISIILNLIPTEKSKSPAIHNPILAIWTELGLIGIIMYLGVLVSAIWSFIQSYFYKISKINEEFLRYHPILLAVFVGYILSWIKGGGMESAYSYFLLIGMLTLPLVVYKSENQIRMESLN